MGLGIESGGRKPAMAEGDLFDIRDVRPGDQLAVSRLYKEGLLIGQLDPYDPATDLEHIMDVYVAQPPNHFWVAEAQGSVIGTVAIAQESPEVAHLRRLRVEPTWQANSTVAGRLVQTATAHARDHGF